MKNKTELAVKIKGFWRILGPGLVTGAADDDPSGIATYSQTGAQFGYGQLWTALYMLPLMIAVQEACARIGLVTGKGITTIVRQRYSPAVLYAVVGLVVVANTINIGADLGAMAAAAHGQELECAGLRRVFRICVVSHPAATAAERGASGARA